MDQHTVRFVFITLIPGINVPYQIMGETIKISENINPIKYYYSTMQPAHNELFNKYKADHMWLDLIQYWYID